jgi:hypothetical protein
LVPAMGSPDSIEFNADRFRMLVTINMITAVLVMG